MSGIIALSINQEKYKGNFECDLFWMTFYHQHLGQEYGGIALKKESSLEVITEEGLFRTGFEKKLCYIKGMHGIGHISAGFPEPYVMKKSSFPGMAACFAGNIINKDEIIELLVGSGCGLDRTDDIALISHLIVRAGWLKNKSEEENFLAGINYMAERIYGTFALAILAGNRIYVARHPEGHEPVLLGAKQGAVVAASESCGFYNQGFSIAGELYPGEVGFLENGKYHSISRAVCKNQSKSKICSFKWVYTCAPQTEIMGITAAGARKRIGANLARKDIKNGFIPDIILPVPDSGRFHAIGYKQEYDRQNNRKLINRVPYYDEELVKYPYSLRSYTPADQAQRKVEAQKKIIPVIEEDVLNLFIIDKGEEKTEFDIVVVDDSIVRGTQTVNELIPKITAAFSKIGKSIGKKYKLRIHLRIANPKLISTCSWGKANKEKKNLAALKKNGKIRTNQEMARKLKVASCVFSEIADIAKAIGRPELELCFECSKQ